MEKLMESEVELDVDIFYYTDDEFESCNFKRGDFPVN